MWSSLSTTDGASYPASGSPNWAALTCAADPGDRSFSEPYRLDPPESAHLLGPQGFRPRLTEARRRSEQGSQGHQEDRHAIENDATSVRFSHGGQSDWYSDTRLNCTRPSRTRPLEWWVMSIPQRGGATPGLSTSPQIPVEPPPQGSTPVRIRSGDQGEARAPGVVARLKWREGLGSLRTGRPTRHFGFAWPG